MAKNSLRRTSWRQRGMLIDFINTILCVFILIAGIFLLVDVQKHLLVFPLIFVLSAAMNVCLGIKKYKMDEYAACIIAFIAAVLLLSFCVFSLVVVFR